MKSLKSHMGDFIFYSLLLASITFVWLYMGGNTTEIIKINLGFSQKVKDTIELSMWMYIPINILGVIISGFIFAFIMNRGSKILTHSSDGFLMILTNLMVVVGYLIGIIFPGINLMELFLISLLIIIIILFYIIHTIGFSKGKVFLKDTIILSLISSFSITVTFLMIQDNLPFSIPLIASSLFSIILGSIGFDRYPTKNNEDIFLIEGEK